MESMLPDLSLANPDPGRAKVIPKDQDDFLRAYESRQAEMISFLKENRLITNPRSGRQTNHPVPATSFAVLIAQVFVPLGTKYL
ncbi:MAG: hypothetical protein ACT4OT_01065 [Acidobacteriota bacterium]